MVPSFRKPHCRPPPFPSQTVGTSSTSYYSGYFARMTADGPLLCGGELDDAFNEKCFLLNSTGSWTEAPPEQWLPVFRSMPYSYATEFAEGWWIAGEYRVVLSFKDCFCSFWSRLKLNTKIGLDTTHPPPPPQTFRPLPGLLGG